MKIRLKGRQQRWIGELQSHDQELIHVPGIKNTVPGALTRRPEHITTLHQMILTSPYLGIYQQRPIRRIHRQKKI